MTTHLSNKATLEKTHTPPSPEVMNFIIKEFHSYSDEIRQSILKMSAIFNTLDKKYYSCNKEIKCSADLMATYSNTLNKLSTSLNQVNEDFNSILKTDNNLKTSIESSRINAKRLVADISELRASMSYIVGNTYSTQKKKSVY
jgi:methyl-accepting chemotaxis protein